VADKNRISWISNVQRWDVMEMERESGCFISIVYAVDFLHKHLGPDFIRNAITH